MYRTTPVGMTRSKCVEISELKGGLPMFESQFDGTHEKYSTSIC
jgi:hypothetical protein